MARDVPSPCCGSFAVVIKETMGVTVEDVEESDQEERGHITWIEVNCEDSEVNYTCHCGVCGNQYGDQADSRSEALYNYDQRCFELWRKNPNGLRGWMLTKPQDKEDMLRRQKIRDLLKKRFNTMYG